MTTDLTTDWSALSTIWSMVCPHLDKDKAKWVKLIYQFSSTGTGWLVIVEIKVATGDIGSVQCAGACQHFSKILTEC